MDLLVLVVNVARTLRASDVSTNPRKPLICEVRPG